MNLSRYVYKRGIAHQTNTYLQLWDCTAHDVSLVHTFDCCHGAVLAVVAHGETIYAGCQDGYVKVWDLETKSLVREIIVQEGIDILSLSMMYGDLYTASCNGQIQVRLLT